MELVSGYRDPLMDFSETMAQWHRSFQSMHNVWDHTKNFWADPLPDYPQDSSPYWILHRLDCSGPGLVAACRLQQAGIEPQHLSECHMKTSLKDSTSYSTLDSCVGQSILLVSDASGLPLGYDVLEQSWPSCLGGVDQAGGDGEGAMRILCKVVALLRRCVEAPMTGGKPRKPQGLRLNDRVLHRSGPGAFIMRWPAAHYCHVCKKRSFPSQLKACSQCEAVLYCSDQCFQADANHEPWCAKLATYLDHTAQLAKLPFSYAAEVTSEDFNVEDFLFRNRLLGGYWLHWSLLVRSPRCQLPPPGEQPTEPCSLWLAGWCTCLCVSVVSSSVSWRQYYEWRGLSLSCPVAPVLSSALSIYYIVTSLVPTHCECCSALLSLHSLRRATCEKPSRGTTFCCIRVKGHRRAYHMLQGPKPDLVIGESVGACLECISLKVPAYFCELSELSCECSQQVMNQATGGAVSPPLINPFHCPLRITGGDNRSGVGPRPVPIFSPDYLIW
uniref:MYND-type domain-containing protein n=1 Tax=Myripristis murdjan TaxID=586833 RepID=A0A667Z3J9_9TELE